MAIWLCSFCINQKDLSMIFRHQISACFFQKSLPARDAKAESPSAWKTHGISFIYIYIYIYKYIYIRCGSRPTHRSLSVVVHALPIAPSHRAPNPRNSFLINMHMYPYIQKHISFLCASIAPALRAPAVSHVEIVQHSAMENCAVRPC